MSTDGEDFLTPRGLLVEGSFVCDGPSFEEFSKVVDESLNLPYTGDRLMYWSGISEAGLDILSRELLPLVDTCYDAVVNITGLQPGFREIGIICDLILNSAKTAETDYDAMFQGLNDLTDDPDNESLREKVAQLTNARLEGINYLEDLTDTTFGILKGCTDNLAGCEYQLKIIVKNLNNSECEDKLRERDPTDVLEDDLAALKLIRDKVAAMDMEAQSAEAMQNLELLLGAIRVIITDLTAIKESVEKATVPANEIILNSEKSKIIRKWNDLGVQVQKFKDYYFS